MRSAQGGRLQHGRAVESQRDHGSRRASHRNRGAPGSRPGRGRISRRHAARHRQAGAGDGSAGAVRESAQAGAATGQANCSRSKCSSCRPRTPTSARTSWASGACPTRSPRRSPTTKIPSQSPNLSFGLPGIVHVADRLAHYPDITDVRSPELGPEPRVPRIAKTHRTVGMSGAKPARRRCQESLHERHESCLSTTNPTCSTAFAASCAIGSSVETANGAAAGLAMIESNGPFAVVVSDMRMPDMNGARFLARVNEIAPDTVRMVLSGQADIDSTVAAVNEGHIFRFLLKPCDTDKLVAVDQQRHRSIQPDQRRKASTREHAQHHGEDAGRGAGPHQSCRAAARLADREICRERRAWRSSCPAPGNIDLASMFSQVGCITLPAETLAKVYGGQPMSEEEAKLYESHPEVAGKLLGTDPAPRGRRRNGVGPVAARRTRILRMAISPARTRRSSERRSCGPRCASISSSTRAARPGRRPADSRAASRTCRRPSPKRW